MAKKPYHSQVVILELEGMTKKVSCSGAKLGDSSSQLFNVLEMFMTLINKIIVRSLKGKILITIIIEETEKFST